MKPICPKCFGELSFTVEGRNESITCQVCDYSFRVFTNNSRYRQYILVEEENTDFASDDFDYPTPCIP